jgi:hypothetical protein
MFEQHTGENMFILVSRVLDVLCPRWRTQMIGISSDGANAMIGHLQGVVTASLKSRKQQVLSSLVWSSSVGFDFKACIHRAVGQ